MEYQLIRDFFRGFMKIHILYHADKHPIYGQAFSTELQRHGYDISFGILYPVLHKLEGEGLLTSYKENVAGIIRKYYTITMQGREVLSESRRKIQELVDELN